MPEGHTIHRLALDLAQDFAGRQVASSSPQGRFAEADELNGRVFASAQAIGKHLFVDIGGKRVHVHLGLFGKFRRPRGDRAPSASVRWRLQAEGRTWDLTGPTACHLVGEAEMEAYRERLGADPLAPGPRPPSLWQKVHKSKRPIGALLLDQSLFAGIGNVYRAELLFLVGLSPETPGALVPKPTFERMWKLAKELLQKGVAANRIVTVPGPAKRRRDRLYVYKRWECMRCQSRIRRSTLAARTMYHCPTCQTEPAQAAAS